MNIKKIPRLIKDAEKRLKLIEAERTKIISELNELRQKQKSLLQVRESESLFLQASVSNKSPGKEKISLFYS